MASFEPATLTDEGDIFGDEQIVILEPEAWDGLPFPLLKYIDIGDRLTHGEWIVVLHYHDCPKCQEARREYEALARDLADQPDAARVALIEMPPYDPAPVEVLSHGSLCVQGRLSNVREWFVEAPVEIHMSQGVVRKVSGGKELGHAIEATVSAAEVVPASEPVATTCCVLANACAVPHGPALTCEHRRFEAERICLDL